MGKMGKIYNMLEIDQYSKEKKLHKKNEVHCEERDAF